MNRFAHLAPINLTEPLITGPWILPLTPDEERHTETWRNAALACGWTVVTDIDPIIGCVTLVAYQAPKTKQP